MIHRTMAALDTISAPTMNETTLSLALPFETFARTQCRYPIWPDLCKVRHAHICELYVSHDAEEYANDLV
jgi:hypothetical protein